MDLGGLVRSTETRHSHLIAARSGPRVPEFDLRISTPRRLTFPIQRKQVSLWTIMVMRLKCAEIDEGDFSCAQPDASQVSTTAWTNNSVLSFAFLRLHRNVHPRSVSLN
jgi:hypothetical protein